MKRYSRRLKFEKVAGQFRTYRATNLADVNPTYTGIVKSIEVFWVSRNTGWSVIRNDENNYEVGNGECWYRKSEVIATANAWVLLGASALDR
jgi:hypothetical protein